MLIFNRRIMRVLEEVATQQKLFQILCAPGQNDWVKAGSGARVSSFLTVGFSLGATAHAQSDRRLTVATGSPLPSPSSMTAPNKRVAVLSPVAWRTPPRQYGAWETVASNITEGLVARGWDVTLFASRDSVTRAHLHAVVDRGYEEDPAVDPKVAECLHISEAFEHAAEFDLIHSHYDFMALTYTRLVKTPVLTTIHGFSSPKIMSVYKKYRDGYFVSISDSDRAPGLSYLATVYNGIDLSLYPIQQSGGDDLIFLGRIHPDKGVHLAIEVARMSGRRLIIAGIIQDEAYYRESVKPRIDDQVRYIGPVDVAGKNELFEHACALLHLNTIPERFGLVLAEANAAGVPVIAMDLGSCREVIKDGQTGFLVNNVNEAAHVLERLSEIDRGACRQRVEQCFSIKTMVEGYERVYSTIFDLEAKRQA
jgi:glycosyltransferase involved in cell wall biosynthesis